MAQEKENVFSKYSKYFYIIFVILFLISGVKSCNRGMVIKRLEKEQEYIIDSLNSTYSNQIYDLKTKLQAYKDTNLVLKYEIKLANEGKLSAEQRAVAVQSIAEKINKNTTIKIENKRSEEDSVSINNK